MSSSRDAAAHSGKSHHSSHRSDAHEHTPHQHHSSANRSSRSRSRSRSRERDRKHSSSSSSKPHTHRDRSRSRSRSRDKKSKRDKDKDDKHRKDKDGASSGSTREIERALRKAQKLLSAGGDATAIAAAGLDPALIDALIAQQKAAVTAASASAHSASHSKSKASKDKGGKDGKKSKKRKKDHSSSSSDSDSDASSSSSSDEDAGVSLLLSDGVTPRLFKRDYFARSTEFRLWLKESQGKSIDQMPSKKAHRLFAKRFVTQWNARKLDAKYYKGIDTSAIGASALTAHRWSFSKGLSETERSQMEAVRDEIDSSTHHHSYAQEFQGKQSSAAQTRGEIEAVSAAAIARKKEDSLHPGRSQAAASASAAGPAPRPTETYDERQARIAREKIENKRLSIRQSAVLDELVPKSTGREAMLDARRAKGAYARADRSGGDGLGEVAEADAMGGAAAYKADYAAMVQNRASAAAQRDAAASQKLSAHQLKEQETMRKMLASIGQADKYKIG